MKTKVSKSEQFFINNPELNKFKSGNTIMLDKEYKIKRVSIVKGQLEINLDHSFYAHVLSPNKVYTFNTAIEENKVIKIVKDTYTV